MCFLDGWLCMVGIRIIDPFSGYASAKNNNFREFDKRSIYLGYYRVVKRELALSKAILVGKYQGGVMNIAGSVT